MKALLILACPSCQSTMADGMLVHSGLCPRPEARQYLIPLLPADGAVS